MQKPEPQWFVLRDLKRSNSNSPAYKVLPQLGFEVFTPMHWILKPDAKKGGQSRQLVPFIQSLLFVNASKPDLDVVINRTDTLQYRFVKGAPQGTPMVVPEKEMTIFINAISESKTCTYFSPEEITPNMLGREIAIHGGALNGYTATLLKHKGSSKKKILVELPGILVAAVEVNPDFIELL